MSKLYIIPTPIGNLAINSVVEVIELNNYDNSRLIKVGKNQVFASEKVCGNLTVVKI